MQLNIKRAPITQTPPIQGRPRALRRLAPLVELSGDPQTVTKRSGRDPILLEQHIPQVVGRDPDPCGGVSNSRTGVDGSHSSLRAGRTELSREAGRSIREGTLHAAAGEAEVARDRDDRQRVRIGADCATTQSLADCRADRLSMEGRAVCHPHR